VLDRVEVRVGPASESLRAMHERGEEPFGVVFIDADKKSLPEYLEWSLKLSRPGSVIVADNVVRDGKVLDAASSDPDIQGVRRMTEMMASNPRLSATAIPTVGARGYDGFALALVLE
jgi:predicted O-methyltransferase YrrM